MRGAPDWIAEVFSPATASYDRTTKLRAYERAGVHRAVPNTRYPRLTRCSRDGLAPQRSASSTTPAGGPIPCVR